MAAVVPVHFQPYGDEAVPTLEYTVRHWRTGRQLDEFALIDTGSNITVLPRALLLHHGFPVRRAKRHSEGIGGIGGRVELFFIENVALGVTDTDNATHIVNLDRLHFTDAILPTIIGRDLLRALNGKLVLDFSDETGYIEIG